MKGNYSEVTKNILLTIAITGLVVVAATSPYFLIGLAKVLLRNKKYHGSKENEEKVVRSLRGLKKNNMFIVKDQGDGNFVVQLTEKGKEKVEEINFDNLTIKKPNKWDGRWRVVTFDIPENRKPARDALRSKMKELKFYQLQKSVFICPYPCEKEILFLCEFFDIFKFVDIIIAEKIHNDGMLKKVFRL